MQSPNEIVENIRYALQNRDYKAFADCFSLNGVYELPYALQGRPPKYEGRERIYTYIASGMANANKLFSINILNAKIHPCVEENVLFAEFFLSGTPINTGKPFTIASSAALITCQAGQVVRYRDFPNSAGIAQALGNLANYIALLNDVNRH